MCFATRDLIRGLKLILNGRLEGLVAKFDSYWLFSMVSFDHQLMLVVYVVF